jgi:uncharacterized delta-60 repeat protein
MRLRLLGICVSSVVVSAARGQSPPVPEGSLPQTAEIARVVEAAGNIAISAAGHRAAATTSVGQAPKKPQAIAGAAVSVGAANTGILTRPTGASGSDAKFSGPVRINEPGAGLASRIVEQDGRFILAGGSDVLVNGLLDQGIFVARFEADGTPDLTYGQGGSTRISLFAGNKMANNSSPSIALAPNGMIAVARTITDMFPGNMPGTRVGVARLSRDGIVDRAFGSNGLAYTTIKNAFSVHAVAVQRDNKIVLAGESGHRGDCRDEPCVQLATLVRYAANGQPDPTFGAGGIVRTMIGGGLLDMMSRRASFSDLIIQENGLIVAAGEIEGGTGGIVTPSKMLIAEYLPTGQLNPAFGRSGAMMLTFDGPYQKHTASSLALRENGKILAGGTSSLYEGSSTQAWLTNQAFAFAQLTLGGDPDMTFGNGGKIVVDVNRLDGSSTRPLDDLSKVMLTPSGDIYAAGMASGPVGNPERGINIVALNSDGSLKQNFGSAGLYSFGTYAPWRLWLAQDALLTSAGRLVISGTHWPDHSPDGFVLWAYSIKP